MVTTPLTKAFLLAAYQVSDEDYWEGDGIQCEWRSLGGLIEYSPDLLAVPRKGATPVFVIAIRSSRKGGLRCATVLVKAKKSGRLYEQKILPVGLCRGPTRMGLPAIPLRCKSSKAEDWYALGNLSIQLEEAIDWDGEDLVKGKKISDIFRATATNSRARREIERWGRYWNTDSIHREKERIRSRYYRELVYSARQLGRPLTIRRTLYQMAASRAGLDLTFWSQNLFSAAGIHRSKAQSPVTEPPKPQEAQMAAMTSTDITRSR